VRRGSSRSRGVHRARFSSIPGAVPLKLKLLLVMVVRDHADIIDSNLRWHFDHGVEFAIVTDNGSTDGTLEILQRHEREGRLLLLQDPSDLMEGAMLTRMAMLGREQYGAEWILPVDGDELFVPSRGSLQDHLERDGVNLWSVPTVNFVPTVHDDAADPNPVTRLSYKVGRPPAIPKLPYLLKRIQRKILFKAADLIAIRDGSHKADMRNERRGAATDISVYHYPIRSREQFFRKVVMGGELIERNRALANDYGYHWRSWYALYKRGQLDREWRRMQLSPLRLAFLQATGVVSRDLRIGREIAARP
jgi:glycosyltransferase involved in cell wall biosynthesis